MTGIARLLHVMAAAVLILLSLPGCDGGNGRDNGATDYSGTYYVTMGAAPRWVILINQSDSDVAFALEGPGRVEAGTGIVSGNEMTLTADVPDFGVFTAHITFPDEGETFSGIWEITGDNPVQGTITGTQKEWDTYDVDAHVTPQFAHERCIELEKIQKISKFRSGEGHDFSDDFESCRSMKHYYYPKDGVDGSTVGIFSPITGTVIGMTDEWAGAEEWKGTAVSIKPEHYDAFHLTIFHVKLNSALAVGDVVIAGQELGASQKTSGTVTDIAVGVHTPDGYKLVSYFEVMGDSLFQAYQTRGISSREDAIITKGERDADPLSCDGEEFADGGDLENWVILN